METARYELPNLLRARAEECRTPSAPAGAPLLLAETLPVYGVPSSPSRSSKRERRAARHCAPSTAG